MDPSKKIRETLFSIHPISYRIKSKQPDKKSMDKALFIRIIKTLKEIDERRDFLHGKMGMDLTAYEDKFFEVIEDLMKMHFNKEQLALIQTYLYTLSPDQEWDGKITLKKGGEEIELSFKEPHEVYRVVTSFTK